MANDSSMRVGDDRPVTGAPTELCTALGMGKPSCAEEDEGVKLAGGQWCQRGGPEWAADISTNSSSLELIHTWSIFSEAPMGVGLGGC